MLQKGDHVICIAPAYQSLHEIAQSIGCQVSFWDMDTTNDGRPHFQVESISSIFPTAHPALKRSSFSSVACAPSVNSSFSPLLREVKFMLCARYKSIESLISRSKICDFSILVQVSALKALMQPKTRAVFVNFPHNPSGAVASREEWDGIVECCQQSGAYLFSDEMYRCRPCKLLSLPKTVWSFHTNNLALFGSPQTPTHQDFSRVSPGL